jgi:hypothetical protein
MVELVQQIIICQLTVLLVHLDFILQNLQQLDYKLQILKDEFQGG